LPLSDRDYMRTSRGRWSSSQGRSTRGFLDFGINPVFAIIIANIVLYIAVLFAPNLQGTNVDKFTYYLGLIPHYFTERPWTIFTAMFIHDGFWHLFFNMLVLFFFGSYLSRLVGNNWFTLVYFVGGLAGNLLYLVLGNEYTIAVGASGAIYAVAGALAVLVPNLRIWVWFVIPLPLWVVVLVIFVVLSFSPGVAWQAHIGGLIIGLLAGFYLRRNRRFVF
jgi:membrane associated rhomboid family serine protease